MKQFFLKLLEPNSGVSSRRFIALTSMPFLYYDLYKGARYGVENGRFDFFMASITVHTLILFIAYGFFKNTQVIEAVKSWFSRKKETEEPFIQGDT
jgi:hypothetical protein